MDLLRGLSEEQQRNLTPAQWDQFLAYDDQSHVSTYSENLTKMKSFIYECKRGRFNVLNYLEFRRLLKKYEDRKFYLLSITQTVKETNDDDCESIDSDIIVKLLDDIDMNDICPIVDQLNVYKYHKIFLYKMMDVDVNRMFWYVGLHEICDVNGLDDKYALGGKDAPGNLFVVNEDILTIYKRTMAAKEAGI